MPMDFPDMASLKRAAEVWKFRQPNENEQEDDYRRELADFVAPHDLVESEEIRNKVGWNRFSESQNMGMIFRAAINSKR